MNRDNRGRFARSKKWFSRFIGFVVVVIAIIATAKWYQSAYPITKYHDVIVDKSDVIFASKIDSLEKSVVESIRACESNGHKESDGLIIFDTNKVASIGTLQFQVKTIVYYEKTLYNKVISGKEAIVIALDDAQSGNLAQDILFNSKDGWKNWLNCSNRMSLEAQINAIKKIK